MKTKTIMLGALLTAVFAFSINDAIAIDEMECDVTPGMTWQDGACVGESAMDSCGPNEVLLYEGEGQQSCASKDGFNTDGKYVVYDYAADQTYNGQKVWYGEINWFEEAQKIVKKEKNKNLSEIHGLCARNRMLKYNQPGNPYPSQDGRHCWCRIKADSKTYGWVFSFFSISSAYCARSCVNFCASNVAQSSDFRAVVFSTLEP